MKHLLSILLLLSTSCGITNNFGKGPMFTIYVDSYGDDSNITNKNCFIYLADSTKNLDDLQVQELLKFTKKALSEKGYSVQDSIENADVVILLNYGISDPKTIEVKGSAPVWGQTGISKSTTTGNVYVSPYSNNATYSQQTVNQPTYGVTGYRPTSYTSTYFVRYINLVAYDFRHFIDTNSSKRIWQSKMRSAGSSSDLRLVYPIMLVAAIPWLGKNSETERKINIYETDERIAKFKEE